MKFSPLVTLAISLAITLAVADPAGAEGGFKFPNLNPFAKKKSSSKYSNKTTLQPKKKSSFPTVKLPQWNSASKKSPYKQASQKKSPSKTAAFFAKAKENLTPWKKKKVAPQRRSITGVRRTYSHSPKKPTTKKKKNLFWIPSWFEKEEEPYRKPLSPDEFLAQPRPEIP